MAPTGTDVRGTAAGEAGKAAGGAGGGTMGEQGHCINPETESQNWISRRCGRTGPTDGLDLPIFSRIPADGGEQRSNPRPRPRTHISGQLLASGRPAGFEHRPQATGAAGAARARPQVTCHRTGTGGGQLAVEIRPQRVGLWAVWNAGHRTSRAAGSSRRGGGLLHRAGASSAACSVFRARLRRVFTLASEMPITRATSLVDSPCISRRKTIARCEGGRPRRAV